MRSGQLNHPDPNHPYNLPTWRKLLMLATVSLTAFAANEMAAAHLTVRDALSLLQEQPRHVILTITLVLWLQIYHRLSTKSRSPSIELLPRLPTPSVSVSSVSALVLFCGTPLPSLWAVVQPTSLLGRSTFLAPSGWLEQVATTALPPLDSLQASPHPFLRPCQLHSSPKHSSLSTGVLRSPHGLCS